MSARDESAGLQSFSVSCALHFRGQRTSGAERKWIQAEQVEQIEKAVAGIDDATRKASHTIV